MSRFALEVDASPSTFRRAAGWLLGILPGLLARRRPGPQDDERSGPEEGRDEAVRRLEALRSWLLGQRSPTQRNTCYSPEAKQRIGAAVEEIQAAGSLSFQEIARTLEIDERQLRRIREEVARAGGEPPQPQSRRPHWSGDLSEEIQKLIRDIQASADTRHPYGPMDVKRILEKNYRDQLRKYHGGEAIALSTVSKYMDQGEAKKERKPQRGDFIYPQPFQQVAIDTSHFKLFGLTFYFITVFELGGRLNLLSKVFLKEDTGAVLQVLQEFLQRYPGVEVVVIDRGTPYLNEEVKRLLEEAGRVRLVCPPATPTAKAACERHFRTLKDVLRPAIEKVFPEDAGWEPGRIVKVLEMGIAVFQELYHQIPQKGIDGKSPAERAAHFNPVLACARMVELFEQSLNSEPAEEYARELHRRFQLPGDPEETVKALRQFGTACLRKLAEGVAPFMGPPFPHWMYDPLGFLSAKAREIWEKERMEAKRERLREERGRETRELAQKEEDELEAKEREEREHPERFVDEALRTLGTAMANGWRGMVELTGSHLRELLRSLSAQMKGAFLDEVERLRGRLGNLELNVRGREGLERFLEAFSAEWKAEGRIPLG